MRTGNVREIGCALTDNSPLRQAGAITPITLRCARVFLFVAFFPSLFAQSVLNNSGSPLAIPFPCKDEDLQQSGLLCTDEEPCPIFVELSTVEPLGKKIFLAGNLHSSSSTLASLLLTSDDAGLTWKEPAPRLPGSALEQIQFYDLEHGWAAGETQYPLPRDPFFLVTTDGGASWRQKPVTEEGGPGSILRFWFDSAKHGELIVDAGRRNATGRYHSYESETGGESWMIRGMNGEAPVLKRAPKGLEPQDYRIRAGAKTYFIEKHAGEKWEPVASFLIEVTSCKIKPAEVKEPLPQ